MGKLILVRHGESEANRLQVFAEDDSPLTELGRRQAREVAGLLVGRFQPSAAISSDFLRARQTAGILAAEFKIPVKIVPELHERDFGSLKGRSYEVYREWIARDPAFDPKTPWVWTPPGGETIAELRRRVNSALRRIRSAYRDQEVLVVCHGVVMLSIWAELTGEWDGADIPPNCGVVVLEYAGDKPVVPVILEDCRVPQE